MATSSVLCGGLFAVVRGSKGVISVDLQEKHMNYLPGDVPFKKTWSGGQNYRDGSGDVTVTPEAIDW